MSSEKLNTAISTAKSITNWTAYFMNYDHIRKPNEFNIYKLPFATDTLLKDTITEMCDVFKNTVDKSVDKISDYTADNPKNTMDKLNVRDTIISDNWTNILTGIDSSDSSVDLKSVKVNSYLFKGVYLNDDGENRAIYLLTVKNPILNYKKQRNIFSFKNNSIEKTNEPLVQFKKSFDMIIFEDVLYAINNTFEGLFNMERSRKIVCREKIQSLTDADIVLDIDSYTSFATSGFNPRKFITYNATIVEKLKQNEWKNKLATELKIPIDQTTQKFDLSETANAKNFTLAICDKIKLNMFDDGVCEVSAATPVSFA